MPFPDDPCRACPRDAARGPCLAMTTRNPRYCMHAANGHAGYVALLRGDGPPAPPAPPAPQRTTIPVAESVRLLKLARACEHRDPSIPCGCSGLAICRLGKGKGGVVSLRDCCDCVAGREPD